MAILNLTDLYSLMHKIQIVHVFCLYYKHSLYLIIDSLKG